MKNTFALKHSFWLVPLALWVALLAPRDLCAQSVVMLDLSTRAAASSDTLAPPGRAERWRVTLRVHADGSFRRNRRDGQLSPAELEALRTAIAGARWGFRGGVMCDALPESSWRLRAGGRALVWDEPCSPTPDPTLRRLIILASRLTETPRTVLPR